MRLCQAPPKHGPSSSQVPGRPQPPYCPRRSRSFRPGHQQAWPRCVSVRAWNRRARPAVSAKPWGCPKCAGRRRPLRRPLPGAGVDDHPTSAGQRKSLDTSLDRRRHIRARVRCGAPCAIHGAAMAHTWGPGGEKSGIAAVGCESCESRCALQGAASLSHLVPGMTCGSSSGHHRLGQHRPGTQHRNSNGIDTHAQSVISA